MAEPARILLVDDDEDARDISVAILADGGFPHVTAAAGAGEGYGLLGLDGEAGEEVPPAFDLVLLDIVMPQVDGIEACARIRATRRYRDVPILMVSGQRDVQSLTQAFVAGANDYVTKPAGRIELLARVRSALRLKRELDRRRAREADLIVRNRALQSGTAPRDGTPRSLLEQRLEALADAGAAAALLAVTIRDFRHYAAEHGAEAAGLLNRTVADMLASLPAPLACVLADYGEGLFLILAEGAEAAVSLSALAGAVHQRLDARRIPHGNSADGDHVAFDCTLVEAAGAELLSAPARAIERVRLRANAIGEAA